MQTISNGEDGGDVRAKLNNNWPFRGTYTGGTSMPSTGGSGAANAINIGDMFRLTGVLEIDGFVYDVGTVIMFIGTVPATRSHWLFFSMQL